MSRAVGEPSARSTTRSISVVGRGAKVRIAVLTATLTELTEVGYAGLTIENVARRSGVHKTTIYRRWNDREALVTDAVADLAAATLPLDDTGDIDLDLRTFARGLVSWLNSTTGRAVLAVLQSDAARLPTVAASRRRFFTGRVAAAEPLVRTAVERGQLPGATDPGALLRAVIAPIYLRLLVTAEEVTEDSADRAVAAALVVARAGLLNPD